MLVGATFWSHRHAPGSHQASLAKVESLFQSGGENNLFGAQREAVKAAQTLVPIFMMLFSAGNQILGLPLGLTGAIFIILVGVSCDKLSLTIHHELNPPSTKL